MSRPSTWLGLRWVFIIHDSSRVLVDYLHWYSVGYLFEVLIWTWNQAEASPGSCIWDLSEWAKYKGGLGCNTSELKCTSTCSTEHKTVTSKNMNKCSVVAEMGDRLAAVDMGQKLGVVLFWGGAGSASKAMSPGPRPPYQMASWSIQPFGHNRHGPKIGGYAPLGGAGSPSNTIWPMPRPTYIPRFIFIHLTVWPQYTNVTDRPDSQTDNGPIAIGSVCVLVCWDNNLWTKWSLT